MRIAIAFMAAAGALVLTGCGGSKSSSPTEPTTTASTPTTASHVTTTALPKATVIAIQVKDGKPVGGITRTDVEEGPSSSISSSIRMSRTRCICTATTSIGTSQPGGTARIRFQAKIPGVFEAELENRKLQILELTVK